MHHRVERLASGMLAPMNPYVSSVLGLFTLLWGLFVLNPLHAAFERAAIYSKAIELAPEWAWGTWAAVCGICVLCSIFFGRAKMLARSLGFATWHWFTIAGMCWWGDWQNTAGLTYTFISIYGMLAFLNIRVNYVKQGIKHIHEQL